MFLALRPTILPVLVWFVKDLTRSGSRLTAGDAARVCGSLTYRTRILRRCR